MVEVRKKDLTKMRLQKQQMNRRATKRAMRKMMTPTKKKRMRTARRATLATTGPSSRWRSTTVS
jgi:hypothetical protein